MYEFTMGGAWFKWSLLDRDSKWLAAGSFVAAGVAAVPVGLYAGEVGYAVGYRLVAMLAGRPGLQPGPADAPTFVADPWMAWLTLILGSISALLWWRFSLRQDEMFNRVQNWALAMAAGWTMAATMIWLALAAAGVAAAPSVAGVVAGYILLLLLFWFKAVRRWA